MHRNVGLDLGADAVRLVALEQGFRGFQVVKMAEAQLPADGTLQEKLQQALPQLDGGGPLSGDSIAVSLPGAQVASFPMTLPFTDARRIEQVLPAEVEGAIPFDLDDVVWDYSVLQQADGKSELLVAVVRKQALREALDALSQAGVDPKVVTFAPLALAALGERKLLAAAPALATDQTMPTADAAAAARGELDGEEVQAILEAGPDRADFCLLRAGRPELARSLPTASRAAWDAAATDPEALKRLLSPLIRDLKLTLRARAGKQAPLARLTLAGLIARAPGAAEWLGQQLGVSATTIELLESAQPAQPAEANDPATVALALGLALRAQQPKGRLNFRKDEFAFTKEASQLRGWVVRLVFGIATCLALALALGFARLSSLKSQAKAYDDALCKATDTILHKCQTDWREALAALRGSGSRAAGIPRVSATEILGEVTQNMPEDATLTLEDLEITTTRVTLRGTAAGFTESANIATALRKDKCFGTIPPPRTEKSSRDPGKVSYTLDFPYVCAGEGGGAQ